jgi:hypothetical protein
MSSETLIHLLRPSSGWVENLPPYPEAIDVVGWNQENFEEAWTESISWPEFLSRLWKSKRMQKIFQLDDTGVFIPEKEKK